MSATGLKKAAEVLTAMQVAKLDLLRGKDQQDVRLGRMLQDAESAIKGRFAAISIEPPRPFVRRKARR